MSHLIECDVEGCKSYESASPMTMSLPKGWRLVSYSIEVAADADVTAMEQMIDHPQMGPVRSVVRMASPRPAFQRPAQAHVCPLHELPTFKALASGEAPAYPMLAGPMVVPVQQ